MSASTEHTTGLMSEHDDRLVRAQQVMVAADVATAVLTPSAELFYLTGFARPAGERLIALVLRASGPALFVAPAFELTRLELPASVQPLGWNDGDDAQALLASALIGELEATRSAAGSPARRIAIGPSAPAALLIGIGETLGQTVEDVTWVDAASFLAPLRLIKSAPEIEALQQAALRGESALERVFEEGISGLTERELTSRLTRALVDSGMPAAGVGVLVASGAESADLRHTVGDRIIRSGDAVLVDLSGSVDGYQADLARTVVVGTASPAVRAAHATVVAASEAAFRAIRPGLRAGDVDRIVRSVIVDAGLGELFPHRAGHGIGIELHEGPHLDSSSDDLLAEGMTFSIQPGVYMPGEYGIRVEDVGVVTSDGSRRLNTSDRSLRLV